MPKKKPQKPIVLLSRPLSWLDEREAETLSWLMNHFPLGIISFENTVNVLTFAIEQLEEPIRSSSHTIDEADVRQLVTVAELVEALDSVHAARCLLLSGYFSKMLATLRTMIEALRTADICKDDAQKAREWIQHKEIKKPATGDVHSIIKNMMRNYDFLSRAGSHPLFYSRLVSSIGKPYHEIFQENDSALRDTISWLIEYLNMAAGLFLKYVDECYSIDWNKDPELKRKRNIILGIEDADPGEPSGT